MLACKGAPMQPQNARISAGKYRLRPRDQVSPNLCNALLPLVAMGAAGMCSKVAQTPQAS